jgi:hypothetical protein
VELPKPQEIKKLVDFLRKQGVSHLKSGEFEISLSPSALFPQKPAKESQSDHIPTEGTFSEEDALFWSSAGIPEEAN